MKLHRSAAVVAAAAIAPVLFLAPSAVAATAPAAGSTEVTTPSPAEAGKLSAVPLTITGQSEVTTGQWLQAKLTVKNPDDEPLTGFSVRMVVGYSGWNAKSGEIELEQRSQDGSWAAIAPDPSDPSDPHEFKLEVPTLEAHGKFTVDLRLRLATRLIYEEGINGFIAPFGMPKEKDRPIERSPFFYFFPAPADGAKRPDTGDDKTPGDDKKPGDDKTPGGEKKPDAGRDTGHKPSGGGDSKPSTGDGKTPGAHDGKGDDTAGGKTGGSTQSEPVAPAKPAADKPSAEKSAAEKPVASGGDEKLAATGAGPATPWAIGGSAAALTAGAGLVIAARRRTANKH
ncbi:hypothetical protein SSP35_01_01770 [Streptomyces sp. NBRC 110611]|uniref:LAETG motif-containing sortase-dependent surface protein n=1 Tax=Streptomyces sp. NBRC 110611 TaxID=1621259 RepID=UPI00082F8FB7|nr:LAETG motif-containing sortase-dependent surface protein [Streptomyces sp. NBRC 110611]GAU64841.1 hypothetical protein SSP35_01_01770 [Streptomyces sp. NBRC 110611]